MNAPLYFEDFKVGREWRTEGRTVTEADIAAFAGVSGDFDPLHMDEEYARGTVFGGRIAHGLLGAAVASGLVSRMRLTDGTLVAWLGLELDFREPVRPGDTVRAHLRVDEVRPSRKGGRGLVRLGVELRQGETVLQAGRWSLLVRSREPASRTPGS
jgi:acyl dehydratase